MEVEWTLQRKPSAADWMFGTWDCDGKFTCRTLEDELREVKVMKETAVDAGRFQLIYEYSPRFKKRLLTLVGTKRHKAVRVHSVRTDDDTEGCIGVGSRANEEKGELFGGLTDGVREQLEALFVEEEQNGNTVWLNIRNAPGDHYVDSGNLAPTGIA